MIVAVLALSGEITIPTYTSLWTILMCGQMCMLVIDVAGAIKYTRFILGTITAFYGAPSIATLFLWLLVLLCSYTIVCCMGVLLLTVVYPRVVVKNYTKRWRRLLLSASY